MIIFNSCSNEGVVEPSLEEITQLIETKGEEYWSIDSGQSTLIYQNGNLNTQLLIMMAKSYGFYLEYVNDTSYYVAVSEGSFDDVAQIFIGGDPIQVPRTFFLDIENSIKQVEEFFRSGSISSDINWMKRSETGWHYGVPSTSEKTKTFKSIDEIMLENKRSRKRKRV